MIKLIKNTSQFHQFLLNWKKSPIQIVSSPRNFNLSQFIKLIKLNLEEHVNIIQQQKPIDQLWKKLARKSETPNFMKFENSPSNAWQMKRNWKRKGIIVLSVLEDKNPREKLRENDKKTCFESGPVKERENRAFFKSWIVKNTWKTLVLKNSLNDFQLIEKQVRSIENYIRLIQHQSSNDRARQIQTKILIPISIGQATGSIDWKFGNFKILKSKAF